MAAYLARAAAEHPPTHQALVHAGALPGALVRGRQAVSTAFYGAQLCMRSTVQYLSSDAPALAPCALLRRDVGCER